MGNLLVVIAVALFIAAIVVLVVAIRRPKTPATPGGRRDPLAFDAMPQFGPRQLGPGAIVSHGGIDYVVRGSVTFREGPFVWWEHLLEGGDTPTWLSVQEDDGRLELAMWVKRTDLGLQPGGQHVIDGVTFQETERGHAGYTTEARRACRPAVRWTTSTAPVPVRGPTSPCCCHSSAGHRTWDGR